MLIMDPGDPIVEQFIAITGVPYDVARGLLEACGGNLELAVNMHMEGGSTVPSSNGQGSSGCSAIEPGNDLLSPTSYKAKHGVRAPIPQSRGVLIEDEGAPRRMVRSRRLPQTIFDPFQDFRNTGKIGGRGDTSKKQSLAALFRPPHDIMFQGTFHEAKLSGQHNKKWLLVNLQDSKEFPSQVLNRDVWSNHNVKDIIRQHFIFWQVYCITDEGLKFKQLYHVTSFPYIAIIDPMTGEKMADWGALTESTFTDAVLNFLSNHQYDANLPSASKAQETVADRSEESQLEAAIKASLKEAQVSKREQQLVFSDDSDVDYVSLTSSDNDCTESTLDADDVEYMGSSVGGKATETRLLGVEYVGQSSKDINSGSIANGFTGIRANRKRASCRDDDELPRKMMRADISETGYSESGREQNRQYSDTDTNIILFRLPDGARLQQRFISSHPIKELFTFLQTNGIDKSGHEIVTQFPRRNLCEVDPTTTLRDLGLHRRETIFIHTTD